MVRISPTFRTIVFIWLILLTVAWGAAAYVGYSQLIGRLDQRVSRLERVTPLSIRINQRQPTAEPVYEDRRVLLVKGRNDENAHLIQQLQIQGWDIVDAEPGEKGVWVYFRRQR
jgi:hypothetical protein